MPKMRMVVLTCNRIDHLKKTLQDWSMVDDIFVVDNGSTDGTQEFLSNSKYECLLLTENIGISGAEMAAVSKIDADWFMFVDDDISPETPDVYEKLKSFCFKVGSEYSVSPSINIDPNYYPTVLGSENHPEGEFELISHAGGVLTLHKNACDSILHIKKNIERFGVWRKKGGKIGYAKWVKIIHRGEGDGVVQRNVEYKF